MISRIKHIKGVMLNYVAGVFVLFFCMDVYYFLRMLVVLVVAAIRPKSPGIRPIRVPCDNSEESIPFHSYKQIINQLISPWKPFKWQ